MKMKVVWAIVVGMLVSGTSLAADWPQYLGPERNSTSPETGLMRSWPEEGPEVLWTVAVGRGFGGPVVKDGKVYLLDRDDEVGDTLRSFTIVIRYSSLVASQSVLGVVRLVCHCCEMACSRGQATIRNQWLPRTVAKMDPNLTQG